MVGVANIFFCYRTTITLIITIIITTTIIIIIIPCVFPVLPGDGMILQLDLSDNISLQEADNPDEMEKLSKTICLCLEHNSTLLALEFANNNLGYYGPYPLSLHAVDYFKDVIKALPKSTVRRLDISGNYILGPSNKILSTWALLLRLYCKQQCEVLRARNNGISSPALSLVASILGPTAIIEELDLSDNMAGRH